MKLVTVISSLPTINGKQIYPQHTYTVTVVNSIEERIVKDIDHTYRKLWVDGKEWEFLVESNLSDQEACRLAHSLL